MKLVVVGAGGHGKVVLATALDAGVEVVSVLDDDRTKWGSSLLGAPVVGPVSEYARFLNESVYFVLAIGENRLRQRLALVLDGLRWTTLIHPRAYVHPTAILGEGTVVFGGAVVQPFAEIGRHVIVNTGTVVEHDCRVGDWAHLASGVRLAGGVEIGEGAFLGAGAVVIPGKRVGKWSVVGAGGVVVRDIPNFSVAYGVPATVRRIIQEGS